MVGLICILRDLPPFVFQFRAGQIYARTIGLLFFHTFLMNYFLKNPQRGKKQLATLDFPLAEVRPVLVVAVTSSVEKEGRCP